MFGKHRSRSPFSFIFTIFRLFLSLVIMAVLLVGVYSAYKSFSGVDPLKVSPQSVVQTVLSSENFFQVINQLLSADPKESLSKASELIGKSSGQPLNLTGNSSIPAPNVNLEFKFAIVTDSHNDNQNLTKALEKAKSLGAKFVIGLGDYTNVGTPDELRSAKLPFDTVGLPYYTTAGDHDLWDSRNRNLPASKNFTEVFGSTYQSFGYGSLRVIIFYNSDNYNGLDSAQLTWLDSQLKQISEDSPKLILAMASIPLYHPSSDHIMGKEQPKLKSQAQHLIKLLNDAKVNEVFAGDIHAYSRYTEPESHLKMTTVGAITAERNTQSPRFVMIDVYQDGSYNVQDIEIR